jgi:3-deoxy-7-phosphoheptulonate synthase
MTKASIACGADGLLIEVHATPDKAIKDGAQSLNHENFARLVQECRPVAQAVGRDI